MVLVDSAFDDLLGVHYELHRYTLGALRALVLSWYVGVDFLSFDERSISTKEVEDSGYDWSEQRVVEENNMMKIIKESGIVCNYFFALKEGEDYFLLDGFNRLLTTYGSVADAQVVYLKLIVDDLADNKLMSIMLRLNLWKLSHNRHFNVSSIFDRGMRLLVHKKFNIEFDNYNDYDDKRRTNTDFSAIEFYFIEERDYWRGESHSYEDIVKLFASPRIVDDLKEVISINNYLEQPFKHYDKFVNGFVMFLSRRRLAGDYSEIKFKTYVDVLLAHKFYKKLVKMSWTDSTRKNVYFFFKKIENGD